MAIGASKDVPYLTFFPVVIQYKMPNIIPTLTGYELCKGGGINGGWKVVQRNHSCPKMCHRLGKFGRA